MISDDDHQYILEFTVQNHSWRCKDAALDERILMGSILLYGRIRRKWKTSTDRIWCLTDSTIYDCTDQDWPRVREFLVRESANLTLFFVKRDFVGLQT